VRKIGQNYSPRIDSDWMRCNSEDLRAFIYSSIEHRRGDDRGYPSASDEEHCFNRFSDDEKWQYLEKIWPGEHADGMIAHLAENEVLWRGDVRGKWTVCWRISMIWVLESDLAEQSLVIVRNCMDELLQETRDQLLDPYGPDDKNYLYFGEWKNAHFNGGVEVGYRYGVVCA